jgi:hypothetical protein
MSNKTLHSNTQPTQVAVDIFLDTLRESGESNMFGAGRYIQERFGITKYDANRFLVKWMETFKERDNDES